MNIIKHENTIFAKHITAADIKDGLSFFSEDSEFLQIGSWKYNEGKELQAHIHNEFPRTAMRTYEAIIVLSGAIETQLYSFDEEIVERVTVKSGEIIMLLEGGHSFTILEDNTVAIEAKNGPYMGLETDKRKF
jgi:hypothetical protein